MVFVYLTLHWSSTSSCQLIKDPLYRLLFYAEQFYTCTCIDFERNYGSNYSSFKRNHTSRSVIKSNHFSQAFIMIKVHLHDYFLPQEVCTSWGLNDIFHLPWLYCHVIMMTYTFNRPYKTAGFVYYTLDIYVDEDKGVRTLQPTTNHFRSSMDCLLSEPLWLVWDSCRFQSSGPASETLPILPFYQHFFKLRCGWSVRSQSDAFSQRKPENSLFFTIQ